MRKQNSTKRTLISFAVAFSLATLAWTIQNYSNQESKNNEPLKASIFEFEKDFLAK